MKHAAKILSIVGLSLAIFLGLWVSKGLARDRQTDWASIQGKRCSALGEQLYHFHRKQMAYPESLRHLVDAGFLTEARYQELMFQENPSAPAREWQYYKPTSSVSPALFSGRPVNIWNCPRQTYIAGHADGSAVLFGPEKLPHYRSKLDASQLSE